MFLNFLVPCSTTQAILLYEDCRRFKDSSLHLEAYSRQLLKIRSTLPKMPVIERSIITNNGLQYINKIGKKMMGDVNYLRKFKILDEII